MMLILFDVDDTLIDHTGAQRAAAERLHAHVSSGVDLAAFLRDWEAATERHFARYLAGELDYREQRRARVRDLVGPSLSDREADDLVAIYIAEYQAAWTLFDDVVPCLKRLAGYRLGAVTNGNGVQQRAKLGRTGLLERLEHLVIADECGHAKPDPAIFALACRVAGAAPEDTVYVGDRYDLDAAAARSAGLRGVWLDRRYAASDVHAPPIIRALSELPDLLEGRAS
jgi:putative hydrolase of the HAD superfamily